MRARAVALVAVCALVGCGGSGEEDAVRDALTEYTRAMLERDGAAACARMTEALQEFLLTAYPEARDCPGAVASIEQHAQRPDVEIEDVEVDGDTATASVSSGGGEGSRQTLRKVEGTWRVDVSPTAG